MENAADEVSVIALVENLELTLPRRLPARFVQQQARPQQARIIELGDKESKIALKRQLNLDVEKEDRVATKNNGAAAESAEERESLEILRRLPPGTVLIKQVEAKKEEEQRAMSEERPRKLSQRIRNKKTTPGRPVEVRRNPLRSAAAARKDPTKESRSARQRLLADKRRGVLVPSSASEQQQQQQQQQSAPGAKRSRNNTPYMNTRSVTRKMHNVGATYEAPTWRDQTEWKEWPVHGMHERPVYHAQFGLAAEYNGRLFASFDGEGYREINAEAHIEIVRVDPRVESLDRLHQLATRHQQQQQQHQQQQLLQSTVAAARHQQKLGYASLAQAAVFAKDRLRIPAGLCGLGARLPSPFEHLQTSLGLAQQQQQQQHLEQLRSLERLQHFENLQRLGSRVRLQTAESCQKFAISRLLSKEMFRSLQNATLAHTQQAAATTSQQSPPSKCLIMPRATVAPVTLPLCNVQPFKGNAKGKLFFVRASDASKKAPIPEKTSTVTSSAQSTSISWSDANLRKKLKSSPSIDMLRTYAATSSAALNLKNRQSHLAQQLSRGFPPIRLAESTGIFRPSLQKNLGLREDPGLEYRFGSSTTSTSTEEDHLSEVLDLSKKEAPKEEKMDLDKDEDKGIR